MFWNQCRPLWVALFAAGLIGSFVQAADVIVEENVTYVSKDDPPVLTLHGDRDALVPIAQATILDEKMKSVGESHTLIVLEGQGHGFGGEHGKRAADATWSFFEQHLKPQKPTE